MRSAGFSIGELVVVLAIAAVIVAIASPTLGLTYRRSATRSAADQFISTHALARSTAVRFGGVAELHIDAATSQFWVEADTGMSGGGRARLGAVKRASDAGVIMSSDRAVLCFDARGFPTTRGACEAADATIVFSKAGRADTLRITPLGRVLR